MHKQNTMLYDIISRRDEGSLTSNWGRSSTRPLSILYKSYITIRNSGELVDGRLWVDITLKNESEYAAIDPEIFIAIALENPTGLQLLNTKSSGGVAMPPRREEAGLQLISASSERQWSRRYMFLFVAGRYKHPITGDFIGTAIRSLNEAFGITRKSELATLSPSPFQGGTEYLSYFYRNTRSFKRVKLLCVSAFSKSTVSCKLQT